MLALMPSVQIFKGIPEKLNSVSLRRDLSTGNYVAVMRFQSLASLAHFRCFRRGLAGALHLIDAEGEILIKPAIKMLYGGPKGQDLRSIECKIEINQDDCWERLMRFIHCYAKANGLTCRKAESGEYSSFENADNLSFSTLSRY